MKNLVVNPSITIKKALKKISQSGQKCLVVTDENNSLLGTLSDGDIRKSILNGAIISDRITKYYQSNPTAFFENEYELEQVKKMFLNKKFDLIPVINTSGVLVDILIWDNVFINGERKHKKLLNISTVIMAGGRGTRMEPFTKVLPKPLIPIHEKPVIEHIIEQFTTVGINKFIITVNYKAQLMKAYFGELNPKYSIEFFQEKKPLGTAGSLHFIKNYFDHPFFVTNCDILVKSDYESIYNFHIKGNYDITLIASAKEYVIPYGTCELDINGDLNRINEKPQFDFLINTGLYILNPDILKLIPKNKFYHITNLIEEAKKKGRKIGVYPVNDDDWIDVGQWSEYRHAIEGL